MSQELSRKELQVIKTGRRWEHTTRSIAKWVISINKWIIMQHWKVQMMDKGWFPEDWKPSNNWCKWERGTKTLLSLATSLQLMLISSLWCKAIQAASATTRWARTSAEWERHMTEVALRKRRSIWISQSASTRWPQRKETHHHVHRLQQPRRSPTLEQLRRSWAPSEASCSAITSTSLKRIWTSTTSQTTNRCQKIRQNKSSKQDKVKTHKL